mmetsp:Transcript_4145/g.16052  ORF Transcript_4145/g.16052 Transcript_4145/m.16052 type:complete len:658 (+) Transcript_4145:3106-5079(+)
MDVEIPHQQPCFRHRGFHVSQRPRTKQADKLDLVIVDVRDLLAKIPQGQQGVGADLLRLERLGRAVSLSSNAAEHRSLHRRGHETHAPSRASRAMRDRSDARALLQRAAENPHEALHLGGGVLLGQRNLELSEHHVQQAEPGALELHVRVVICPRVEAASFGFGDAERVGPEVCDGIRVAVHPKDVRLGGVGNGLRLGREEDVPQRLQADGLRVLVRREIDVHPLFASDHLEVHLEALIRRQPQLFPRRPIAEQLLEDSCRHGRTEGGQHAAGIAGLTRVLEDLHEHVPLLRYIQELPELEQGIKIPLELAGQAVDEAENLQAQLEPPVEGLPRHAALVVRGTAVGAARRGDAEHVILEAKVLSGTRPEGHELLVQDLRDRVAVTPQLFDQRGLVRQGLAMRLHEDLEELQAVLEVCVLRRLLGNSRYPKLIQALLEEPDALLLLRFHPQRVQAGIQEEAELAPGRHQPLGHHMPEQPDQLQQRPIVELLRELLDAGAVATDLLQEARRGILALPLQGLAHALQQRFEEVSVQTAHELDQQDVHLLHRLGFCCGFRRVPNGFEVHGSEGILLGKKPEHLGAARHDLAMSRARLEHRSDHVVFQYPSNESRLGQIRLLAFLHVVLQNAKRRRRIDASLMPARDAVPVGERRDALLVRL